MPQRIMGQEWFEGLLDFVFPPLCLGCGEFHEETNQICPDCLEDIEVFDYPLCLNCQAFVPKGIKCPVCLADSVILFADANYQPPLKEIIHQFKFRGITSPAITFARLAYEKFNDKLTELEADAIIPIPLHPSRENLRGYNQAELISKELAELMKLPVETDVLFRYKKGREQARLPFKSRMANIKNAFVANISDKNIKKAILVDDVVTTGATALEAKKCLEQINCKVTGIISIAHGV